MCIPRVTRRSISTRKVPLFDQFGCAPLDLARSLLSPLPHLAGQRTQRREGAHSLERAYAGIPGHPEHVADAGLNVIEGAKPAVSWIKGGELELRLELVVEGEGDTNRHPLFERHGGLVWAGDIGPRARTSDGYLLR